MIDVEKLRREFPILGTNIKGRDLIYFDNGATTQKPDRVIDAISRYYRTQNANVGRSVHTLSMIAADTFENARRSVQKFIGAASEKSIVFTRSTTEGINFIAAAFAAKQLKPGDEVLVTEAEHHSNILPWKQICASRGAVLRVIPVDETGAVDLDAYRATLSHRSKIVAFSHISNVLGALSPVKAMTAAAHEYGAITVVDGAQAVAHVPVNVEDFGVDFYCFSAHKMYGPMGCGVLYGKEELLEAMEPPLFGGGIAKVVSFDNRPTRFVSGPQRLEFGTPDIAGAVGLEEAIRFLDELQLENIVEHDANLVDLAMSGLRDIPGVNVYNPAGGSTGLVTFTIEGLHPYDIGNHLDAEGIAVRTGVHCAVPITDRLGVVGTVRASFGVYNTPNEVERFVAAVAGAAPGFWSTEHPQDRTLEHAL